MLNKSFVCEYCAKIFTRKFSLKRHIKSFHRSPKKTENNEEIKNSKKYFECNECSMKVRSKYGLKRHIYSLHVQQLRKKKPVQLICLLCTKVFISRRILNEHYQEEHHIKFEFEERNFHSFADFEKWMKAYYILSTTWLSSDFVVRRYRCHRSGHYEDQCKKNNKERQRCLKLSGTKKLQGHCPAEVTVKQQRQRPEGICIAYEQKTHVGHSITDLDELKHLYKEKKKIVQQLKIGVPKERILKDIFINFDPYDSDDNPGDYVACETIETISVQPDIKDPFTLENDAEYIESFVEQHRDVVLFYKRQYQNDTVLNVFDTKDFVLVIQYKFQQEYLRKFGHRVVAFDATYTSDPCDFLLHTMLVMNTENEAIPVAFLLSNRGDQCVTDIFVRCMKENVGVVNTKTLMSDMNMVYYKSWCAIMGTPTHSLYCTWHVQKSWRLELTKLIPETHDQRNLRRALKTQLYDLANELDENIFLSKLTTFLSKENPKVQPFLQYFRQHFLGKEKFWAFCYRLNSGVNYNMHVESFHRSLKDAGGKKIKTLSGGLWIIDKYIKYILYEREMKLLTPTVSTKLRELRKRHTVAEKHGKKESFNIEFVEDRIWQVGSFGEAVQGVMEMYVIRMFETKECSLYTEPCGLVCEPCGSCFHQFFCSCYDYAINSNMCKHIHAVGLYLKNQNTTKNIAVPNTDSAKVPVSEVFDENINDDIEKTFRQLADLVKSYVTPLDTRIWREIKRNFLETIEPTLRSLLEPPVVEELIQTQLG